MGLLNHKGLQGPYDLWVKSQNSVIFWILVKCIAILRLELISELKFILKICSFTREDNSWSFDEKTRSFLKFANNYNIQYKIRSFFEWKIAKTKTITWYWLWDLNILNWAFMDNKLKLFIICSPTYLLSCPHYHEIISEIT